MESPAPRMQAAAAHPRAPAGAFVLWGLQSDYVGQRVRCLQAGVSCVYFCMDAVPLQTTRTWAERGFPLPMQQIMRLRARVRKLSLTEQTTRGP